MLYISPSFNVGTSYIIVLNAMEVVGGVRLTEGEETATQTKVVLLTIKEKGK